ncbi:MAG TPA: prepilin-type N-terminal cleavage/methylation domain-containing protein [Gaiellaceae bacterium]|jgi:prepilin-type N-terminal cleavage/methylation domain-containing protein
MRALHDESGFTLPELLIVLTITVILMGGLATILSLGLKTSATSNSVLASQSNVVVALDRLDEEGRCASSAKLVSGGAGVTLTYPFQCSPANSPNGHTPEAPGSVTWCVTGGSLMRYAGSACSGTGLTLTTNVTSATPFSCIATVGHYPAVKAVLTVNTGTTAATASSGIDTISLENGIITTSNYAGCS